MFNALSGMIMNGVQDGLAYGVKLIPSRSLLAINFATKSSLL